MSRKPTFSKSDLQIAVRKKFTALAEELQPLAEGMESQALEGDQATLGWVTRWSREIFLEIQD